MLYFLPFIVWFLSAPDYLIPRLKKARSRQIPLVAKIEYKKTADEHQFTGRSMGMGTQVVIGSRSVEPGFLILLFPHRQGEQLPSTTWSEDRKRLTIAWKDQTDTYDVSLSPEGRRIFNKVK